MINGKITFRIICILAFFTYFAHALTLYIQSSYLERIVGIQYAGFFIALATIVNLLAIYTFPQFIKQFSNYWVMVGVTTMYIFGTIFLIVSHNIFTIVVFYIIHFVTIILIGINLDIFLENITENKRTGVVRTKFLTIANFAILLGPLTFSLLLGKSENYNLTFFSAIIMAAFALGILLASHKYLTDHIRYNRRHIKELFGILKSNKNMFFIFILSFILKLFYCIMVFYTPLYLHSYLGFSWSTIGIIFSIILLPFVFFTYPAGKLADKYFGEKELMILGIGIMALFTGLMAFISYESAVIWTLVLFMTRVGASLNEAMQEVYFFKIVNREDVDIINLFRDMTPVGWLAGSAVSIIIIKFLPIQFIFLFLSLSIIISLYPAFKLKDTK